MEMSVAGSVQYGPLAVSSTGHQVVFEMGGKKVVFGCDEDLPQLLHAALGFFLKLQENSLTKG